MKRCSLTISAIPLFAFFSFLLTSTLYAFPYNADFNNRTPGPYTRNQMRADFTGSSENWDNGFGTDGRVQITTGGHTGNALQITYPRRSLGPDEGGAQLKINLPEREEVYSEYKVKFPTGFDFVKGGKLPGLASGAANSGHSKPNGTDGWSARYMWEGDGSASIYLYHMDQSRNEGDYISLNRKFTRGRWHTLRQYVKLNTPGQRNGVLKVWFDGNLVLNRTNLRYRTVPTLKIDKFYFSTFFGGGNDTWRNTKLEHTYFDDFKIYTPVSNDPNVGTIFADFEQETERTNLGGALYSFNDSSNSGASRANFSIVGNARGGSSAFGGTYSLNQGQNQHSPFVGLGAYTTQDQKEWDISEAQKITFYYRNIGADECIIRIETEESRLLPKSPYHRVALPAANNWTYIELTWDQFRPPNWSDVDASRPLDLTKVTKISLQMRGNTNGTIQNGEFWIDEIRLPGLRKFPAFTSINNKITHRNQSDHFHFNRNQNAILFSYPNDISSMITISLFTLSGSFVTSQTVDPTRYNGTYTLDVNNLKSNGLYIAQIRSGKINATERVLIEK